MRQSMDEPKLEVSACTCEYSEDPLGVDTPQPRFGWILASAARE